VAFYIFGRYKLPVAAPLILFASAAVVEALTMIARKKPFKLGFTAALAALFFVLLGTDVSPSGYVIDRANAYCRLGDVHLTEKRLDDALSAYGQAREIAPHYWAAHFGLGQTHERKRELEAALESYELTKKFNPGTVDPFIRMGHIYFQMARYEESSEQFRGALKYKPDRTDLHRILANIYKIQGDDERASEHLRKLRDLDFLREPQE
jgi:tetratricopeptide (TPR) repeat protein